MRTFYTLHVRRNDGSWRHHVMRGEVPKVGDTVFATLAGDKVSTKVGAVTDPPRNTRQNHHRGSRRRIIEVLAEENV
jgi:hypothetical protein